jgi:hypothetical protein
MITTMPFSVYATIEVALRVGIRRAWESRNDPYWRDDIKRSIAALKYIRNK